MAIMTRPAVARARPPDRSCLSCHGTRQMWNPPIGPVPCPLCTPPPVRRPSAGLPGGEHR